MSLLRLRSRPSARLRPTLAVASSALLHVAGLTAAFAWTVEASRLSLVRPELSGRQKPLRLQVTWADVSAGEAAEHETVLVTPEHVRIEQQELVRRPARQPSSQPRITPLPSSPYTAPVRRPMTRQTGAVADAPETLKKRIAPRGSRRRMRPATAAMPRVPMPASSGVSSRLPPRFVHNPPPNYPAVALENRWEGEVLLQITIATDGRISRVRVFRSSGHPVLDAAAAGAVRRWRARPATENGHPAASVWKLPVRFRLPGRSG